LRRTWRALEFRLWHCRKVQGAEDEEGIAPSRCCGSADIRSCVLRAIGWSRCRRLSPPSLDATTTRLRWTAVESVECKQAVTISVFRGTSEDFTPSSTNRIASGLTKATYLAKEPTAGKDYYYSVKAVITQVACVPHSGTMRVYPLDLGQHLRSRLGMNWDLYCASHVGNPMRQPTSGFPCSDREQGTHEYLIGCRSVDYEGGDWTCVNLTSGTYQVGVHSRR